MLRWIRALGASAVFVASITACQTATEGSADVDSPAEELYIAVSASSTGLGMQAAFEGVLALTEQRCFGFQDPAMPDQVTPIIFPAGSVVKEDGSGVTIPESGDLELGGTISSSGGFIQASDGSLTATIPDACTDDTLIALSFG